MTLPNWSRKTLITVAAGAVILAAVLGVRAYQRAKTPAAETVAPRRGPVTEVVSETGKVIAFEDLTLSFKRSGRVAAILVKEGDSVKKDQPLLRLNTSDLAIQRREALASLAAAEARYAQAAAGATEEELRVLETSVRNAEISLETARRSLSDVTASNEASIGKAYADLDGQMETLFLKSSAAMQTLKNDVYDSSGQLRYDISSPDYGTQSQALTAYTAARSALASMEMSIVMYRASATDADRDSRSTALLADAKTVRDAAQLANALMQASVPVGGTTQTAFDTRKANVKAAWTDMNLAVNAAESQKLTVASTVAAASTSENAAAQAVRSAEGALASAQRTLESRSAPLRDVDKAVYLAAVSSARASVALIDQQIADATLEAPTDGIVGNIDISLGEIAQANAPVGTLISSGLRIEVEVSELDIAGIRADQPVAFTFDAIEGRTFAGHVTTVAPRETSKDEDVYYKVNVAIDDADPAIRIGMTADLDIEVGRKDDALLVPRRQVYRREGKDYVKVLTAGKKVEEIEVTVGLRGRDEYEIVSGVRESDLIVVE
ncbi:MAG TPA: HlyD family efflux transporter periplasmic adaptor subunit [Patescibacteria group bacterium]|nr:HlyD family efflux transporter periplasmic adaptor subunit [Patescibacteria group bacterium]